MPSAVIMDYGSHDGSRTGHDPSQKTNGAIVSKKDAVSANHGGAVTAQAVEKKSIYPGRMNDLPDEIVHITQGFVPLSLLLTRLAQKSHNSLQETIEKLARMPMKPSFDSLNTPMSSLGPNEPPNEITQKKVALLSFAQEQHAKWVKALVIAEWSRKADMVSKLIDLKAHLDQQRLHYDISLDNMVNVKRDLTFARMPSPDLKTALQILSTGQAPYMPDLQYIEPAPLTAEEQSKWLNDLNTLLSLRLNLDEFDKIPAQFKDYEIHSGRVTFKVKGEFEVDLTIGDEDFETQFWFIDFRFGFKPAPATPSDGLVGRLEACVNDVLNREGLNGCYQFLHELVLTQKIRELQRQTVHLSKNAWTGTLVIEPLNRALAIQYWTSRSPTQGPKSWIMIAVNSGRKKDTDKPNSRLVAKWYRDNQEVKDYEVPLDTDNLSAENLLTTVVGKHIEFILRGIHDKLLEAPRFKNKEAGMVLQISKSDPVASLLTTQIGYAANVSLKIELMTGAFAITPCSNFGIQFESQLNNGRNQVEDIVTCLENIRCASIEEELGRTGSCMGWQPSRSQFSAEEIRSITKKRDWARILCLQKKGWGPGWYVMVSLSFGGDEWWLVEMNRAEAKRFHTMLPLNKGYPELSETFWQNLTLLTTGMISHAIDLKDLHRQKIRNRSADGMSWVMSSRVRIPAIGLELSTMFPLMVHKPNQDSGKQNFGTTASLVGQSNKRAGISTQFPSLSARIPWARDVVTINFRGVQPPSPSSTNDDTDTDSPNYRLSCIFDAIIAVRPGVSLRGLKDKVKVDRDVSYNPIRREFCLRLRHPVGEPTLPELKVRIMAVDRFVSFLEAFGESSNDVINDSVSLTKVSCLYREPTTTAATTADRLDAATADHRLILDLSTEKIQVQLEKGNPHLRAIDLMQSLVNLPGGIRALVSWLPPSLPALNVMSTVESKWEHIHDQGRGEVTFTFRTLDWIGIRYSVPSADKSATRLLLLECRLRLRKGEPWWHIWRPKEIFFETDSSSDNDVFTPVLQAVWNSQGDGWIGLRTGAAGRLGSGMAVMITAVDEAVRGTVSSGAEVANMG